jgi:hypothetical protein
MPGKIQNGNNKLQLNKNIDTGGDTFFPQAHK